MAAQNPFAPTMVRMKLPADAGTHISFRGFNLEADAERCVEVPADAVAELSAHGLVRASEAAPKTLSVKR